MINECERFGFSLPLDSLTLSTSTLLFESLKFKTNRCKNILILTSRSVMAFHADDVVIKSFPQQWCCQKILGWTVWTNNNSTRCHGSLKTLGYSHWYMQLLPLQTLLYFLAKRICINGSVDACYKGKQSNLLRPWPT